MIRLALAFMITTLPAAAQDFRGLRPGMDASALGPIGEPMETIEVEGVTYASFPGPFGQTLELFYDEDGVIRWLAASADPNAPEPPELDGLQVNRMTLADVQNALGPSSAGLELDGIAFPNELGDGFDLIYDSSGADDFAVVLAFVDPARSGAFIGLFLPEDQQPAPLARPLPREAVLVSASLIDRTWLDELYPGDGFIGGPRSAPILFPLPLDKAFPSLIP